MDKNEQHCKEKQYYNQVANNLTILQYVFFFLLVLKCNGKSPLLINVSCVRITFAFPLKFSLSVILRVLSVFEEGYPDPKVLAMLD